MTGNTLTPELLNKMNAYWRAANYLSVWDHCLRSQPLRQCGDRGQVSVRSG